MFQSALASLKLRLNSLRSSKKQKRKSMAPVSSTSEIPAAEKAPAVAPALDTPPVLPPIDAQLRYERKMGDSETSYYLPSRANGVNDMYVCLIPWLLLSRGLSIPFRYLHLGFRAPTHLMARERVRVVWAILRQRHPLLAATVEMHDYDDVRFV
jgi:hypothetical protein